jgi:hypothetical protein
LGYSGTPFTWDNRRDDARNIKVRLDRALADDKFLDLYGDSAITHVQTAESDHCAVKIELKKSSMLQGRMRARPFRYENMWRRHPSYENIVATSWGVGADHSWRCTPTWEACRLRYVCGTETNLVLYETS